MHAAQMTMRAIPPMTPPAIAPEFVFDDVSWTDGELVEDEGEDGVGFNIAGDDEEPVARQDVLVPAATKNWVD